MSILGNVLSYFNSSSSYFSSSLDHASKGYNSGTTLSNEVQEAVGDTLKSLPTLASSALLGYQSYKIAAGEIMGFHAALTIANMFTFGTTPLSIAAMVTKVAASALVFQPALCLGAVLATTIIATHPVQTLNAVKASASMVYHAGETAFHCTAAVAEAALGTALLIGETVESVTNAYAENGTVTFADIFGSSAVDCTMEISGDASLLAMVPYNEDFAFEQLGQLAIAA